MNTPYIIGVDPHTTVPTVVKRFEFFAPEGQQVHLRKLITGQGFFEIVFVDGRIGEELLPLTGPFDLAVFSKHDAFEVGTITSDEPLVLYLQAFGTPSMEPHLNMALLGEIEDWVAPPMSEQRRRAVGEINVQEYIQWLVDQGMPAQQQRDLVEPLNRFCRGETLENDEELPVERLIDKTARLKQKAQQEVFRQQQTFQNLFKHLKPGS